MKNHRNPPSFVFSTINDLSVMHSDYSQIYPISVLDRDGFQKVREVKKNEKM